MKLAILALAFLLLVPFSAMGQSSSPIRGDYWEVRANHVFTCGCLQSGEAVIGGREAILTWRFESGEFSGVPLHGLAVVAVIVGPENLGVGQAARRTALFLDGSSSEEQKEAGLSLLRTRYSDLFGEIVSIQEGPVEVEEREEGAAVVVPGIAKVVVRVADLPEDAEPGAQLWYEPFIPLARRELTTVVHDEYWGDHFLRRWRRRLAGVRGFHGEFQLP